MRDQSVLRPLPVQDNTNTEKRRRSSLARMGFESTIPVFERALIYLNQSIRRRQLYLFHLICRRFRAEPNKHK
jgi:hypothetical protein